MSDRKKSKSPCMKKIHKSKYEKRTPGEGLIAKCVAKNRLPQPICRTTPKIYKKKYKKGLC